jgi:hypothetical protein
MKKYLTCLLVAFVTIFPLHVLAQSNSWTGVKALPKGTDLIIERKNDRPVVGYLASVSDDSIAITSDAGAFFVGRDNVANVYYAVPRSVKKHANRGALIGGLLGFGLGFGVSLKQYPDSEAMPGAPIFLGAALLGGWIGSKRGKGKDKGERIYAAK